jgi:hypothetical protein
MSADYKLFIPPTRINLVKKLRVPVLNPLYTELKPICHLLALLGAQHILHISRIRVNEALHHEIEKGTNRKAQTHS